MRIRTFLLAASALAAISAGGARAQAPVAGPYISLGAGYNYEEDVRIGNFPVSFEDYATNVSGRKFKYGSGVAAEAGVGWGFGNGLRVEALGTFGYNDTRNNSGTCAGGCAPGVTQQSGGEERKFGLLANVAYDFVGLIPGIVPYIGGGVGFQNIEQNNASIYGTLYPSTGPTPFQILATNNQNTTFAYDAFAGVKFALDAVMPGLSVYAEYRYLGTTGDRNYAATTFIGTDNQNLVASETKLGDESNHTGMIGLTYAFGAAPPPPPPPPPAPVAAPTPQPSRTYLVFFDWDRADLTPRARQIVAEAAQASTHVQTTRIEVNGYTDLSGTAAYNQKLSVRRARSVEAELVRDGVPQNEIAIHGYGESNPLVPTAKGVREPQNRRVEIILQ